MIAQLLLPVTILYTLITSTTGAVNTQALQNLKRDEWQPNDSAMACLFMTSEINWQGETQNLCQAGGQCAGLLPDGLSANVSSAGPTDGQTCFLYSAENCTGVRSSPISYPGYADLSGIGFQKKALSWRCYKWCGFMGTDNASISSFSMAPSASSSVASGSSGSASASGSVSVVTITTMITKTVTGSNVNAAVVTDRNVSISTTMSGPQPSYSSGMSTSPSSITSTISASSAASASTLSPLPSPPAPMVSTKLTSGESSSISPSSPTSASPLQTFLPTMLASSSLSNYSAGTGNTSAVSTFTSTIILTHTFGGRGGNETALTTFVIVEPVPTADV